MQSLSTRAYLEIQQRAKKLNVSEFCEKWIPLLYGIHPDDTRYRRACVQELVSIVGEATSYKNIYRNWVLTNDKNGYPKYIRPLLDFADKQYTIMKTLGALPQHKLEYNDNEE